MKREIALLLKKTLEKNKINLEIEEIERFIEIPPTVEMGDYAFPCFFLAKKMRQPPEVIANELRKKITKVPAGFEDIQVLGPYLNFFIDRKIFAENLINEVLKKKENFGRLNIGERKKALIEHTSINPNASPHVGRIRNALIGDSIVKIFEFVGFRPEVHYYVNDVSKQIAMLVLAGAEKLRFQDMLKKYIQISQKVSRSKKLEKKVFNLLYQFEKGDKKIIEKFKKITDTCVKGQEKILSELGIKYDFFDYESKYLNSSKEILDKLKKTKQFFIDDNNRSVLNLERTSIEKKMKSPVLVLTRNDCTGLYPLRDIAYTIDKLKKAEKNVIILGEDQILYFQQLTEALKLLGFKAPGIIHYSFILLKTVGKSKKMSTRSGDVVLLTDFMNEAIKKAKRELAKRKTKADPKVIALGAIKYSILRNHPNKIIIFDLDEALNFEGDTGPYLQYSYVRASSILKKAKINTNKQKINFGELELQETKLIKKISLFPEIVSASYKNLNPSLIANYSYQLAQIFNEFYHSCPVINSDKKIFRILLVKTFKQTLENSLKLLGIDAPEKM